METRNEITVRFGSPLGLLGRTALCTIGFVLAYSGTRLAIVLAHQSYEWWQDRRLERRADREEAAARARL